MGTGYRAFDIRSRFAGFGAARGFCRINAVKQNPPTTTHDKHDDKDEDAMQDAARWHWQGTEALKRLHYPLDVILLCVRWYVAYSLSLRNLEEVMAERGIEVDHSSVHRWVIKLLPVFEKAFRKRKRPVGKKLARR